MRISIELVPRQAEHLQQELQFIKTHFPSVNTVNIPDLLRLSIRSWEGTAISKPYFENSIPHIRAIDFDPDVPMKLLEELHRNRISEILVITGDAPQDMSRAVYPTTSIELIRKIKAASPETRIYAALDPYRSDVQAEYEYAQRKLDAGADGFFTQPFFDLRMMDKYLKLLEPVDTFWGVSPVTSVKSRNYWEVKNKALFPADFEPTLEWNIAFGRKALDYAYGSGSNIYFMPIKNDIAAYLTGIFQ
ncbi:methylenetetrahydrofolate reductase [Paenibacillus sepulcri]|uniref:Methylenetetrahydrofolate reductase n=1 Tax=Paenibacillus sepulcri TaxID=359917 RepID=A0ABS7C3Q8_9BACL|nr:methylenetetrahydrofolate reductase [Paenibacillus sepulcri]